MYKYIIAIIFIYASTSDAQTLTLEMRDFNETALPAVRFQTQLKENGVRRDQVHGVSYSLTENGVPLDFRMTCPEPYNSIALVVHTSNYWFFPISPAISDSLTPALNTFIDAVSGNDRILILATDTSKQEDMPGPINYASFGFSVDKPALKLYASGIRPSNLYDMNYYTGSSVYQLTLEAMQRLKMEPGKKTCVVFSANVSSPSNNEQTNTYLSDLREQIVDIAAKNDITIHVINIMPVNSAIYDYDYFIRPLSYLTGGRFYKLHHLRMNELSRTADSIARSLLAEYCTVTYTASNCTDSLRAITMTAAVDTRTVSSDTVIQSPHRPDTLDLTVVSSDDDVVPPEQFDIYIQLRPRIDPVLPLSFSFVIQYDPTAIDFRPPVSVNVSMLPDVRLVAKETRLGAIRCSVDYAFASETNGSLFRCTFKSLTSAGSRPVFITFDSVSITNGCTNTVLIHPDTVFVCRCNYSLAVDIDKEAVFSKDEIRFPIVLRDSVINSRYPFSANSLFSLYLQYDNNYLEPIGVDGIGAITENAVLQWRIKGEDTLEVRTDQSFVPAPGNVLFFARFKVRRPKVAMESSISIPIVRAFSDCCYSQKAPAPNAIVIDGLCDKLVRKRAGFTLLQTAPNPVRGTAIFRFSVHERTDYVPATLNLYRSDGSLAGEVYRNLVAAGEYEASFDTSALPAGTYYYVLTIDGVSQTRSMAVVK